MGDPINLYDNIKDILTQLEAHGVDVSELRSRVDEAEKARRRADQLWEELKNSDRGSPALIAHRARAYDAALNRKNRLLFEAGGLMAAALEK